MARRALHFGGYKTIRLEPGPDWPLKHSAHVLMYQAHIYSSRTDQRCSRAVWSAQSADTMLDPDGHPPATQCSCRGTAASIHSGCLKQLHLADGHAITKSHRHLIWYSTRTAACNCNHLYSQRWYLSHMPAGLHSISAWLLQDAAAAHAEALSRGWGHHQGAMRLPVC